MSEQGHNTAQLNNQPYVTYSEFEQGIERVERRLKAHIDEKFQDLSDNSVIRHKAQEARVQVLENKSELLAHRFTAIEAQVNEIAASVERALIPLNNIDIVINSNRQNVAENMRRINTTEARLHELDNEIDDTLKPHIADIENRSALTMQVTENTRRVAEDALNAARVTNDKIDAYARQQRERDAQISSTITLFTDSMQPHLAWIRQRQQVEARVLEFFGSTTGRALIGAGLVALFGESAVSIVQLIVGG